MVQAGRVFLDELEVDPSPVKPGGVVEVTAHLHENAEFVFGPTLCDPEGIQNQGIRTKVTLNTEWAGSVETQTCVPVFAAGVGEKKIVFRFTAPGLPDSVERGSFSISGTITVGDDTSPPLSNEVRVDSGEAGKERPEDPGKNGGVNLISWAINNPGQAAVLGAGTAFFINKATEELL